ncbi:MAG: ABC transporter permease [Armatimonadota bacterium]
MRTWIEACIDNPFLTRQLRTRMRGTRAYGVLGIWLGSLSVVLTAVYLSWLGRQDRSFQGADSAYLLGTEWNSVLLMVQAALVVLVTPALATGAIAGEREQRTMDLLVSGGVPPGRMVAGKLAGILVFQGWLLLCTLPMSAVGFLMGGVSGAQVATGYLLLFSSAIVCASTGLAISAACRTTVSATLFTYVALIAGLVATAPLIWDGNSRTDVPVFRALHPFGLESGASTVQWAWYHGPGWVPAVVTQLLVAGALALSAVHRLGAPRRDLSAWVRLCVAAVAASLAVGLVAGDPLMFDGGDVIEKPRFVWAIPYAFAFLASVTFATGAGLGEGARRSIARRLVSADPVSGGWFATVLAMLPGLVACGSAVLHADRTRWSHGVWMAADGAAWALAMVAVCWNVSLRCGNRWLSLTISIAIPLVAISVLALAGQMLPNVSLVADVLPVLAKHPKLATGTGAAIAVAGLGLLAARRRMTA